MDNVGKRYSGILGDQASFVELSAVLPDPLRNLGNMDDWIVKAARVSFNGKSKGTLADQKLIKYLLDNQHMSPFEQPQATFTFRMPKVAVIQFLRHRAFHINSESGRYSEIKDEFYFPKWRLQSKENKQMSEGTLDEVNDAYLTKILEFSYDDAMKSYQDALSMGVAKEVARLFLPSDATYQTLVFTGDLRNIMHFMELRSDEHAQWEIQQLSNAMFWLLIEHAPFTLDYWNRNIISASAKENIAVFWQTYGVPE